METRSRILIIDDEEVVLESCTQILASGNYNVTTAPSGEAGLDLVEKFGPDIAFIDLKMPGISGTEVLARINELDPTIVTVVITGYATINSAVEAMKLGAYDFRPKPFTPDEFRLITRRGLERRKLMLETIALRKEKEMLRENFAAIVAHELKAPVNAIKQNLAGGKEGDAAERWLGRFARRQRAREFDPQTRYRTRTLTARPRHSCKRLVDQPGVLGVIPWNPSPILGLDTPRLHHRTD